MWDYKGVLKDPTYDFVEILQGPGGRCCKNASEDTTVTKKNI